MDFFSRLLRRQPIEQQAPSGPTPQQRFRNFKSAYNKLLGIWNNGQGASKDAFSAENHRVLIVHIRELLASDARSPLPHLCLSFAFTNGVLRTLVQIGTAFCESGIVSEVLGVLQLVVDSEEEAFLEDRGLADALPSFVDAVKQDLLGRAWSTKEEQMEGDKDGGLEARMVEVLFGVTSAIRNRPLVLKAWFRPEQFFDDADQLTEADQPSKMEEFPLFYALIPYLTQEGRAGDFARMGILYIVESTSYSQSLERWLVEGDMAALVTSSLGALFSQLSTKLAVTYSDDEKPTMLKFSSRLQQDLPLDVEATSSSDYARHIGSFLANLMFWQDVLEHCLSREVKQTLLDHFQFVFLQKLLYPSLLGSSDASSVAVLTYLRNILESVDHHELVHRMLIYLFGLPQAVPSSKEPVTTIEKARRRKSENLFFKQAKHDDEPTPELFNLSDLIASGLTADDNDTTTCTLRLLSTLLRRHHQESLPHILKTRRARTSDLTRTYGGHEKELDNWITLAENLTSFQDLEQSYERAIYDSKNALELHVCTWPALKIDVRGADTARQWNSIEPYVLLPEDPINLSLLRLLDSFFTNDIETNLSLTQVLLDMASCGNMRLEGWLLTEPAHYIYKGADSPPAEISKGQASSDQSQASQDTEEVAVEDDPSDVANTGTGLDSNVNGAPGEDEEEEEEDETSKLDLQTSQAREEPAWQPENGAPIFQSLDKLLGKVESFHRQLQDFDALLAECKKEIIPESIPAPSLVPSAKPGEDMSRQPSLQPPGGSPAAAQSPLSQTTPAIPLSTPTRGHGRSSSVAKHLASVFGSSPGKTASGMSPASLAPTPAARLRLRLSDASTPTTTNGRTETNLEGGDVSPVSDDSPTQAKSSARGHSRNVSLQGNDMETPTKPSLAKHRGLRGDDLEASPSPRIDQRVVPRAGRDDERTSSLRSALEGDSDSENGGAGSVSAEEDDDTPTGSDSDEDVKSDDEAHERDTLNKRLDIGQSDITVGHLLTNVIILQEFVLEMAALVSVRASYFGEARFR